MLNSSSHRTGTKEARFPLSFLASGAAGFVVTIVVLLLMGRGSEGKKRTANLDTHSPEVESSELSKEPAKAPGRRPIRGRRESPQKNQVVIQFGDEAEDEVAKSLFGNPEEEKVAEEPVQPARANPFLSVPKEINLPDTVAVSAVGSKDASGIGIGKLYSKPSEQFEIHINARAANLGGHYEFVVKKENGTAVNLEWGIYLEPFAPVVDDVKPNPVPVNTSLDQPVAFFSVENLLLKFRWGPSKSEFSEQLRNCSLIFKDDNFNHTMRLRGILKMPVLLVDMEKFPTAMIPIELKALPDIEQLFLEVVALDGFTGNWNFQPLSKKVAVKEELILSNNDNPKIELRFRLLVLQDKVTVSMKAYYYSFEDRKERLSKKSVGNRIKKLTKTISSNVFKGKRALADAKKLRSHIRSVAKRRSSNQRQEEEKGAALRQMNAELKSRISTINKLNKSIPKTKASLSHLNKVASLAGKIHQKTKVKLRVFAVVSDEDYELIVFE